MRSQRWAWTHRYAVPMFVASVVSVILAGGGLIAVIWLGDGDPTDPEQPGVDRCLVGTWQTTSHVQEEPLGRVVLADDGPVFELREDGTGVTDYRGGVRYDVETVAGASVAQMTGTVEFEYEAADGTFRYTSQQSHATFEFVDLPGVPVNEVTFIEEPMSYRCAGDTLRLTSEEHNYTGDYQRTGGS